MHTSWFFDDPDEGLARSTSHPTFVRIAPDDFYYDCTDDFSPFGSDDGNDTLAALQDWYQEHADMHTDERPDVMVFLQEHLSAWGLPVPDDLLMRDEAARAQWLAEDAMHDRYLQAICCAIVAVAFGQLKITGEMDAAVRTQAMQALVCQQWLNQLARQHNPDWEYADEASQRLEQMRHALERVGAA